MFFNVFVEIDDQVLYDSIDIISLEKQFVFP